MNELDRIAKMAARAGMRGCKIPDCDYMAHKGMDFCYCHSKGFNPPISFEHYMKLNDKELKDYRRQVRGMELAMAAGDGDPTE